MERRSASAAVAMLVWETRRCPARSSDCPIRGTVATQLQIALQDSEQMAGPALARMTVPV